MKIEGTLPSRCGDDVGRAVPTSPCPRWPSQSRRWAFSRSGRA